MATMRGHCQHCYDEGYAAGHERGYVDGRTSKASERASDATRPANQWVDLTDEIRDLYGLPSEATQILAVVQDDVILTVLEYRERNNG